LDDGLVDVAALFAALEPLQNRFLCLAAIVVARIQKVDDATPGARAASGIAQENAILRLDDASRLADL